MSVKFLICYKKFLFLNLILLLVMIGCQNQNSTPVPSPDESPTPLSVLKYETNAPITLLYPADWVFLLPQPGLLLFGEEETLIDAEPGAMMTILRIPNARVHGTLEGELNHYLDFGPRQDGYEIVGEIEETTIGEQNAFSLRMSFQGEGERIPFETRIVAAEAANGAVYILAGTSPAEQWEANVNKFSVIIGSFEILE